jgi:hypothetical protein
MDVDCGGYGPCTCLVPGFCGLVPGTCQGASGCLTTDYGTPDLRLTALPDTGGAFADALSLVGPHGQTPMRPALDRTLQHAQASAATSGRRTIVILVTDGVPNACGDTAIDALEPLVSSALAGARPIRTYIVGFGTTAGTYDALAVSGGGTATDIILDTATVASAASDLAAALDAATKHACAQ